MQIIVNIPLPFEDPAPACPCRGCQYCDSKYTEKQWERIVKRYFKQLEIWRERNKDKKPASFSDVLLEVRRWANE